MKQEQDDRRVEEKHLAQTIALAQAQWDEAARSDEEHAQIIRELQEERLENNPLDMGGFDSAQGFLDFLESSQGTITFQQAATARQDAERRMRALARMMDKPYFARVDFRPEGGETRAVYIGRATLMDDDTLQIHVYDWRVPIASVFYQYGVGPAQYNAPGGTVEGEVLRKRQYEIRRGELIYYFDADTQVSDTFLRELLSRPTSTAMKSIVETIQRDQDRIIRDLQTDLLMVQGTAGSGKTSVALHRVAYLMYQGLQGNRVAPEDVLILAPNATFERYIAQVLPDLGEQQVRTMLFESFIAALLPQTPVQPRNVWVESWLRLQDAGDKAQVGAYRRLKGSGAFVRLLDRLVRELPRRWIPFCDIDYDGQCVMTREQARVEICNSTKKVPLGIQLRMLERGLWRRIHPLRPARRAKLAAFAANSRQHKLEISAYARMLSIAEGGSLLRQMRTFTRVDCVAIYRALFEDRAAFARIADGLLPADAVEPLRQMTLRGLRRDRIPYDDAIAIAYLQARVYGTRAYAHFRQLVIDEAQDLDSLQAALLRLLFPGARYTVLGDMHQVLAGPVNPALYDELRAALGKENNRLVTLDKSFRSTREIWAFGAQFLPEGTAGECFSRSGEAPSIHTAPDRDALDALLLDHIRACHAMGHHTVALVCKTETDAAALHRRIGKAADAALLGAAGPGYNPGTVITSLYMAKGLEFDAVLLYDVDAEHYRDDVDRTLLYIGCTRALHLLRLYYMGERSPLLPAKEENETDGYK